MHTKQSAFISRLRKMYDRLERVNRQEEKEVADEVDAIKRAYIEQHGSPKVHDKSAPVK